MYTLQVERISFLISSIFVFICLVIVVIIRWYYVDDIISIYTFIEEIWNQCDIYEQKFVLLMIGGIIWGLNIAFFLVYL